MASGNLDESELPKEAYDSVTDTWKRMDFLSPQISPKTYAVPPSSTWRNGRSMKDLRRKAEQQSRPVSRRTTLLVGVALAFVSCLAVVASTRELALGLVCASLISLVTLAAVTQGERLVASCDEDEALIDDPTDENEILVEIRVIQNGKVSGADRGALALDQGVLMFSGHRSTFSIARADVQNKLFMPEFHSESLDRNMTWFALHLQHPHLNLYLAISPLMSKDPKQQEFLDKLEKLMRRFAKAPSRLPENRHYPPLDWDGHASEVYPTWYSLRKPASSGRR